MSIIEYFLSRLLQVFYVIKHSAFNINHYLKCQLIIKQYFKKT